MTAVVAALRAGRHVVVTAPTYRRGDELIREIAHALLDDGVTDHWIIRSQQRIALGNGGHADLILDERLLRGISPDAVFAPEGTPSEEFAARLAVVLKLKDGTWL